MTTPAAPEPFQAHFDVAPIKGTRYLDWTVNLSALALVALAYPVAKHTNRLWGVACLTLSVALVVAHQSFWRIVKVIVFPGSSSRDYPVSDGEVKISPCPIRTPDNVALSTWKVVASEDSGNWLVFVPGNMMAVQTRMDLFRDFAEQTKVNILAVNYRGVSYSQRGARADRDLAVDFLSAVQYLHEIEEVPLDQIGGWGLSLGGGAVAQAAARAPKELKFGGLVIFERTFSTLSDCAYHLMPALIGSVASLLVRLGGWGFGTRDVWDQIDNHKVVLWHQWDPLMKPDKSSAKDLASDGEAKTTVIELTGGHSWQDHHNGLLSGYEEYQDKLIPKVRELFGVEVDADSST